MDMVLLPDVVHESTQNVDRKSARRPWVEWITPSERRGRWWIEAGDRDGVTQPISILRASHPRWQRRRRQR
jgi:hypothetical protein